MSYQLDGNGAVEIELIKTGETPGDPVALSRKVGITISEHFEGCKVRKWTTVIDTAANEQSGIFQLADAAETVARPLNQYVLLGTYSASLYAKMDKSGGTFTGPVTFGGTVAGISKSSVGLSNVDNTSDANKPISSAVSTALGGKAASSHTHTTANVTGLDTALTAKAPVASPTFTGTARSPELAITGGSIPSLPNSTGIKGQIAYTDSTTPNTGVVYLYICTGTNTWRRIALPNTATASTW